MRGSHPSIHIECIDGWLPRTEMPCNVHNQTDYFSAVVTANATKNHGHHHYCCLRDRSDSLLNIGIRPRIALSSLLLPPLLIIKLLDCCDDDDDNNGYLSALLLDDPPISMSTSLLLLFVLVCILL